MIGLVVIAGILICRKAETLLNGMRIPSLYVENLADFAYHGRIAKRFEWKGEGKIGSMSCGFLKFSSCLCMFRCFTTLRPKSHLDVS